MQRRRGGDGASAKGIGFVWLVILSQPLVSVLMGEAQYLLGNSMMKRIYDRQMEKE